MDFLNDYLVVVVVGICLCVGFTIKNLVPSDKVNRYIPATMMILGVVLNAWVNAFVITPEVLLGGMVSGLASTGMHQLFKQFIGGDVE
jgi:hypothetical protein